MTYCTSSRLSDSYSARVSILCRTPSEYLTRGLISPRPETGPWPATIIRGFTSSSSQSLDLSLTILREISHVKSNELRVELKSKHEKNLSHWWTRVHWEQLGRKTHLTQRSCHNR